MTAKEQIFNRSYTSYFRSCAAFARSFVFDKAEAENLAADALLVLWQKRDDPEVDVERALPFLLGVVRNKAMNFLRARRREQEALGRAGEMVARELELRIGSLEMCDPAMLYRADVNDIIERTLSSLGDRTAEVFLQSRYAGLSHKQIARRYGLSVKTVEYHVSRALRALRRSLKDYLPVIAVFL